MDIRDSRRCNLMNLDQVARYYEAEPEALTGYYEELLADQAFLEGVNAQMATARAHGFTKGIVGKDAVDSVDWFAFERILLYVLVRHLKPRHILETGVYYGGNTVFLLQGLARNAAEEQAGRLISIDFPDSSIRSDSDAMARHPEVGETELYDPTLTPGFIVPEALREPWRLIEGDSLREIPALEESFDFYVHDSEHSMPFLTRELAAAHTKLAPDATILVDDIDWSNAFYAFCAQQCYYPLLLTDNGKDDLRVRIGLIRRRHPKSNTEMMTGVRESL